VSAPTLQRLNRCHVERHSLHGVVESGRTADAIMSVDRTPTAVLLHFVSGGSWLAAEPKLQHAGYRVEKIDPPDPGDPLCRGTDPTYGAWMLVTLGGA
jgi:hypothetical protein